MIDIRLVRGSRPLSPELLHRGGQVGRGNVGVLVGCSYVRIQDEACVGEDLRKAIPQLAILLTIE